MGKATDSPVQVSLDHALEYAADSLTRRLRGVFYTPESAAAFMTNWLIRGRNETVLEPSFGDGIFLRAIRSNVERKQFDQVHILGAEIDDRARAHAINEDLISDIDAYNGDFLSLEPRSVHAIIGNPPYVRLRNLPPKQRDTALAAAQASLGQRMDPSGSLWMPFIAHSMRFLRPGGRMAFVLPYEFTYVRYALPLWQSLAARFGSIQVMRTHERLFPELLQDVVILLTDDYGATTDTVRYTAYARVSDLWYQRPAVNESLPVVDLVNGKRSFIRALLGADLRHLLDTRVADLTVQAKSLVSFNIGYVAGDKSFFHPTEVEAQAYGLPSESLHASITSARAIRGSGLKSSDLTPSRLSQLFLPNPASLTEGERRYIAVGEKNGVSSRYKCRVRAPWFMVPGTSKPDFVLGVFGERPTLLVNDASYFASNSLLCGYSRGSTGEEIAARWYTSLTLLQCELEIHALGGGVLVLVPRETAKVRLPKHLHVDWNHIARIDEALRSGRTLEAYHAGDCAVLSDQLKFSPAEIELVRGGIDVLAHWRTSARTSNC